MSYMNYFASNLAKDLKKNDLTTEDVKEAHAHSSLAFLLCIISCYVSCLLSNKGTIFKTPNIRKFGCDCP